MFHLVVFEYTLLLLCQPWADRPTNPLSTTFEHMVDLSVIKPASKGVKCSTKGSN
ncbi:uncharacterized protein METZ01_LOCUS249656 [marine metagenome]|uniref:Uncharacterized protein n=1 Tax=marine metagenome TaxID=408172 RepID=A0A382IBZ4_9ZZZZ